MANYPLGKFLPRRSQHRTRLEAVLVERILRSYYRQGTIYIDFTNINIAKLGDGSQPHIRLAAPRLVDLVRILINPGMNTGKTYMEGRWTLLGGDLKDFLKLSQTQPQARGLWSLYNLSKVRFPFIAKQRLISRWHRLNCRKHYNMDNNLFEAMLGPQMVYSCAFWDEGCGDLETAQNNKLDQTIERLSIGTGEVSVLDIGCGWGELTRRIADTHPNALVTGITISESQFRHCLEKQGMRPNLSYKLISYDQLDDSQEMKFDRIVSVGMLEHVGVGLLEHYFKRIWSLLRPSGMAVIHSIVTEQHARTNPWIERYIFPGGYIPCVYEITKSIQAAALSLLNIHLYQGIHYAKTLAEWRKNFYRAISDKKLDNYPDEIIRMIDFYLAASETTFDESVNNDKVAQFVMKKYNL